MKKKSAVLVIVILIVGFFVLNVNVMTTQTEEGVHGLRGGGGGGDYKPFLRPQDEAFEEGYAFVSINRFKFSYFNKVRRTSI